MFSVKKLPQPIKDILTIFIKHDFAPLTVQKIAEELQENHNSIYQRILRDKSTKNPFFEMTGTKPKKVQVKKGKKEVVFFRSNNQCYFCKKTVTINELRIQYIDEDAPDIQAWNNIVPVCTECKNGLSSSRIPKSKASKGTTSKKPTNQHVPWEYLTVSLRRREGFEQQNNVVRRFVYYEFIEVDDDNEITDDKWLYLVDDGDDDGDDEEVKDENDGENDERINDGSDGGNDTADDGENEGEAGVISSRSISDILNYFGTQGWELIVMQEIQSQFSFPMQGEIKCVFKRPIRERG